LDTIDPLPISQQGNQYILVLVNYFTRWVEGQPLASITSKDIAKNFF